MRLIPLTQGKFALVDNEDYDWLMTWKWRAHKSRKTFYAQTNTGDFVMMHRLLMCCPRDLQVDHINHDGLDNRNANLRVCTNRENSSNLRRKTSSSYTGVSRNQGKYWRSTIRDGKKILYLGQFSTERKASEAYQAARLAIENK